MINIYFFFLLKILNTVARSCKINWRTERTKIYDSICFFAKIRHYKDKVASCGFKFFECKFLTFITLNPSAKTRLIIKININSKA